MAIERLLQQDVFRNCKHELVRAEWHALVESQSTILVLRSLFGGEVFVGFDLIVEIVLLDAPGIT